MTPVAHLARFAASPWRLGLIVPLLAALLLSTAATSATPAPPSKIFLDLGYTRHELATPAGELVYHEAGSGPPLVFLHGIGGRASSWTWNKIAPAFTDDHRVIVPDWVGWGASEHPARYQLFDDYVGQLNALLAAIGEPATLVTQTAAAGFAAELAETRPELIAGIVFMTPSGGIEFGENVTDPFFAATFTPIASTEGVNRAFYDLVFHRPEFIRFFFTGTGYADPAAVGDDVVEAFTASAQQPNASYAALPFLAGRVSYDFATYLDDLKVPAAMMWGADEREIGPEVRDGLAALRPDVPLVLIPDSSLNFELEQPHETITALLRVLAALPAPAA